MAMIQLHVLGRMELRDGGGEDVESILAQPKRLTVLAYLCLAGRGGYVRRDALTALFWPDSDTEHARAALNQTLYILRQALGPDVIPSRGVEGVGIAASKLTCDAVSFLDLLGAGDCAGALEVYAGDLLPALHIGSPEADRWLDDLRVSLRSQALNAARELGAEAASRGDVDLACERYRRAHEIAPASESAVHGLVENLWRGGHRTAALEVFTRFSEHLSVDYDVGPGPDLQELINLIRLGSRQPGDEPADPATSPPDRVAIEPPRQLNTAGRRRVRSWPRILFASAFGIATIVLLAAWLGKSSRTDGSGWYYANQEYLKAWAAWDARQFDSAQALARKAVELDSTHVRAWALLGYTGALLNALDQGQPADLLPSAYLAAGKAVQLDDSVAAAWAAHAVTRWTYRREWTGAERDYRHALTLSPGPRWEAISRVDLSGLLENLGRCEEAREVLAPYAAFDPPDRILGSSVVVRLHYMCRDYRAAIAEAERTTAAGDSTISTRQYIFLSLLEMEDIDGAQNELTSMQRMYPGHSLLRFDEALLAARSGRTDAAREIIEELARASTDGVYLGQTGTLRAEALAQLHAAVGDLDEAFDVLETAFEKKGHARRLMSHPLFEPLRDDPRYDAMLTRMTLRCRRDGNLHRCQPLQ